MKNKSPEKLQAEYASDVGKLVKFGAARDAHGKILVCVKHEHDGAMAYFFDENHNRRRIFTSIFYRWRDEGKAAKVDPDAFNQ